MKSSASHQSPWFANVNVQMDVLPVFTHRNVGMITNRLIKQGVLRFFGTVPA